MKMKKLFKSCYLYAILMNRVLSSPSVVEYLKKDCVCWGCDVTSKYGYSLVQIYYLFDG